MSYLHKEGLFSFDPTTGAQDLTLIVQNIEALDDGDSLINAYDFARTNKLYFWTDSGVPLSYTNSDVTFHISGQSLDTAKSVEGLADPSVWADIEIRYQPAGGDLNTQVFISGWDGASFGSSGFFRVIDQYSDTGKVAWTKKKIGVVRHGYYPLFGTQAEAEEYSAGSASLVLQEGSDSWYLPAPTNLVEHKDWFNGTFGLFYSADFNLKSGTPESPSFSDSENYVNDSLSYSSFAHNNGKYGEIIDGNDGSVLKTYFDTSDGDAYFDVSPDISGQNVFTRHGISSMTVSLWFKLDDNDSSGTIMHVVGEDPAQDYIKLQFSDNGQIILTRSNGGVIDVSATSSFNEVVAGRWYHLVLAVGQYRVDLFKNGSTLFAVNFGANKPSFVPNNITFCKTDGDETSYLVGGMDYVQLWSRALDEMQARNLYQRQAWNDPNDVRSLSINLPVGKASSSELQPGDSLDATVSYGYGEQLTYFAFEVKVDGYWQSMSGGYLSPQPPGDYTIPSFTIPWLASSKEVKLSMELDGQWIQSEIMYMPDFTSLLSPISYMGHYPLYNTTYEAILASGTHMSYHSHTFGPEGGPNTTYFMPEGLTMGVDQFHGDHGIYAKFTFDGTLTDSSSNGFTSSTSDSSANFRSEDGRSVLKLGGTERYEYSGINLYDAGNLTRPLTISFWIKPPTGLNSAGNVVFGTRRSDQLGGFSFQVGTGGNDQYHFVAQKSDGTSWIYSDATVLPFDQWSHMTIVVQSSSVALRYLNGQYIGDIDLSGGFPIDNHATFTIGGLSGSDESNWHGYIDDLRIWTDKLMSAEEVFYHYENSIVSSPVTVSGDPVNIYMQDSYGDGWNGNNLYIFNLGPDAVSKDSVAAGPITLGSGSSASETINLEMFDSDGVTPKGYKWELLYNVNLENALSAVVNDQSNQGFPSEITFSATDQDGDTLFFRNNNSEWSDYFYLADFSQPELTVTYGDGTNFSEYIVSVSANTEALDAGVTKWALSSETLGSLNDSVDPGYSTSTLSESMVLTMSVNGPANFYVVGLDDSNVIKAISSFTITVSHFPSIEFDSTVYAEQSVYINTQNPMGFTLSSASLVYYDHYSGETIDDATLIETYSEIPSYITPPAAANGKALVIMAEWTIPGWSSGNFAVSDYSIVVDAYGSVTSRLPLLADANDIIGSYNATETNNFDTFSTSYFSAGGPSVERPVVDLFSDGSSYASIPGGVIDTSNTFAMSFWYKSNYDGSSYILDTGGDNHKHYIFSNKGSDPESFEVYFDASPEDESNYQYDHGRLVVKITASDGTTWSINGSTNLSYNQGQWSNYKIVVLQSGSTRSVTVFRNGMLDAFGTFPTASFDIRGSSNNFRIGKPDGSGPGAEGHLADVMFWSGSTGYMQEGAYQILGGGPYVIPDITPPVINIFSSEISANVGDELYQVESMVYSNFSVTDDSSYYTQITPTMSYLDMSSAGSYGITVTAIDAAGNQSSGNFTLNIVAPAQSNDALLDETLASDAGINATVSGVTFDGVANFIAVDNVGTDSITIAEGSGITSGVAGSSDLSISLWVKANIASAPTTNQDVILFTNDQVSPAMRAMTLRLSVDENGSMKLKLRRNGTTRTFNTSGVPSTSETPKVTVDGSAWSHIFFSLDDANDSMTLYIDNNFIATTTGWGGGDTWAFDNALILGNSNDQGTAFNGKMARVKIWSEATSATLVQEYYNEGYASMASYEAQSSGSGSLLTNLELELKFDTLPDGAANNDNSTFESEGDRTYVSFPTSDANLTLPGHPYEFTTESFTVSFWMRPTSATQTAYAHPFIMDSLGQHGGYYWSQDHLDHNNYLFQGNSSADWNPAANRKVIAVDSWTHVTAVRVGEQIKVYINGVLDSTNPTDSAPSIGWGGSQMILGHKWVGDLSDFRIWSREMSEGEVGQIYALPLDSELVDTNASPGGEGEGSVDAYSIDVEDGDRVMIFANGELLDPTTYTIANGTITFVVKPPVGTIITGIKSK